LLTSEFFLRSSHEYVLEVFTNYRCAVSSGVTRPIFFLGKIFWISSSNSNLFGTHPPKAQNDKKC